MTAPFAAKSSSARVAGRAFAMIAIAASIGWVGHRLAIDSQPAAHVMPPPPSARNAPAVTPLARRSGRSSQPAVAGKFSPANNLVKLVRARLAQWHELPTEAVEAQDQLTAGLLALLTDKNSAEVVCSLSANDRGTPFGQAALARWLDASPTQAADWLAAQPDATGPEVLLVARKLLEDPATLESFCDRQPDSPWKQMLVNQACLEGAAKDPIEAINLASRLDPGVGRTDTLQTIAYDWTSRDPLAATNWLVNISDAPLRESLLAAAAKAIAISDPDLAAKWLAEVAPAAGPLNDAALCVIESWVARDPAQAAGWVAHLSAPSSREAAVDLVAHRWLQTDPASAAAWIRQLPEGDAVTAHLEAELRESDRIADAE